MRRPCLFSGCEARSDFWGNDGACFKGIPGEPLRKRKRIGLGSLPSADASKPAETSTKALPRSDLERQNNKFREYTKRGGRRRKKTPTVPSCIAPGYRENGRR